MILDFAMLFVLVAFFCAGGGLLLFVAIIRFIWTPNLDQVPDIAGLASSLSQPIRNHVMFSAFVFPKTQKLVEADRPMTIYEADRESLDWKAIISFVKEDPMMIAYGVREAMCTVLENMEAINPLLRLDKFDMVQVSGSGIDLLRIVMKGNNIDRSAYIEINEYRRGLTMEWCIRIRR